MAVVGLETTVDATFPEFLHLLTTQQMGAVGSGQRPDQGAIRHHFGDALGSGCDHRSVIGAHGSGGKKSLDPSSTRCRAFFSKFAVRLPLQRDRCPSLNLSNAIRFMGQHVDNGSLE